MATFAVFLNDPNERVAARLRETFPEPNHLSLSPTVYLVSGDLLVDALTAALGLPATTPSTTPWGWCSG